MKNLTLLTVLLLNWSCLFAGAPKLISYQAVVRDAGGNVISNQNVSFRLSILRGSATGTVSYSETQSGITNQFGLVTLEIGNGAIISGAIDTISWGGMDYFIKVELDATGGNNYVSMGTTQLLSVPYALLSQSTAKLNQSSTNYYGSGYVFLGQTDTTYQSIAGLSPTINIPDDNCTTLISANGSLYGTQQGGAASVRITLFIDGQAPSIGGTEILNIVTDAHLSGGGGNWSINYPVQLSPGPHVIEVKAKSNGTQNTTPITIDNGGYFDHSVLTVTILKN